MLSDTRRRKTGVPPALWVRITSGPGVGPAVRQLLDVPGPVLDRYGLAYWCFLGGKPPFRTLLGDMSTSRRQLASPCPWLLPLLVAGVLVTSVRLYPRSWTETELGFGIYLTVIWSAPAVLSLMGVVGALAAWRSTRRRRGVPADRVPELLVVQIPTIGRFDVMPALRRVVTSMEDSLPRFFDNWRVDVVAEESSEAIE
jgi:hypothetical protein